MIYVASTGIRRYARLDYKTKQKYGLFDKSPLTVIGSCEVAKNPHIFLTTENQHINEINWQYDGTLNQFGPMIFAENL